ncbi:MAG TPA: hypothetical protein VNL18_00490 [Gemmatimonadales bacterium]|nr:hypothetical protein [Gemmatimonadales bacterium]
MKDHPIDRRGFVTALAGVWTPLVLSREERRAPAVRVEAETTLFYSAPDAQRVLVRFHIAGSDAPAGRLRVFDTTRNLLGTAGALAVGERRLYGELWLPLLANRRLVSELSLPGARPRWDFHTLQPRPRWTVHVLAVVDAADLLDRLNALPPLVRAVESALLAHRPIYGNPLGAGTLALGDHLPFLQAGRSARELERRYGIRASAVAVGVPAQFAAPTIPLALAGAGTRHAVILGDETETASVLMGPDGSTVQVAPGRMVGDMRRLEMAAGGAGMARAVEQWLSSIEPPAAGRRTTTDASALVIGSSVDEIGQLALRTALEWNARYAYPRIVLDGSPPPPEAFTRAGTAPARAWPAGSHDGASPAASRVREITSTRLAERARRTDAMIACLADAMVIGARDLEGIGQRLATGLPGTLVFNPSPFTRTDLVRFPDGVERLATDVPANGYAFIPGVPRDAPDWQPVDPAFTAAGSMIELELDRSSGAIRSLRTRRNGGEWVRAGSGGFNGLAGARLERIERRLLPGIATRLATDRRTPTGRLIRSSVTVYHNLPWVDIANDVLTESGAPQEVTFATTVRDAAVQWEVPAGRRESVAPLDFTWLRWIRLSGEAGALLFGGLETPFATANADGTLTVHSGDSAARYRLAFQLPGEDRYTEEPWRHGWSMEPMRAAAVAGTGRVALPSFGSLVETSDPGAPIIGLALEDDHAVLVYIQEILGMARPVTVRGDVLTFAEARLSDVVGRDRAPLDVRDGGVVVELRPRGVAVIKLLSPGVRAG